MNKIIRLIEESEVSFDSNRLPNDKSLYLSMRRHNPQFLKNNEQLFVELSAQAKKLEKELDCYNELLEDLSYTYNKENYNE